jgi:hypothetical protein
MTVSTPIDINLLEFFRTGQFDYIKLGQTKKWISNNFPDPDITYKDNYESPIWFYGNIEFHFHDEEDLFLIWCDHLESLNAGQNINLDKWILSQPENLTLEFVIKNLNKERIDFKLRHGQLTSGYSSATIEILKSNVELSFNLEEKDDEDFEKEYLLRCKTDDSNSFTLSSFSLMNKGG